MFNKKTSYEARTHPDPDPFSREVFGIDIFYLRLTLVFFRRFTTPGPLDTDWALRTEHSGVHTLHCRRFSDNSREAEFVRPAEILPRLAQ